MEYPAFFALFFMLIALGVPIAYSLGLSSAYLIIFKLQLPIVLVAQHMYGAVDSFSFLAIPFFMLAGAFMSYGGVTKRLINFAFSLVGPFKGGLAQVVAVSGMFFGAISGSSAATTAAIGAIMIDEMEDKGYDREFTAGVVAAGGMVGIIIPPSITLVVYGVTVGVSIGDLFLGGFGPGVLMGLSMCLVSYVICGKKGWGGEGTFSLKNVFKSFLDSFWALLTPVIIIGGIYGGIFTPTEAAAVSVVYALVLGLFVYREMSFADLPDLFRGAAVTSGAVMLIISAAALFSFLISLSGMPNAIGDWAQSAFSSPWSFLLAINILLFVVGMFIETAAAILVLAPILTPVAI